MGKFLKKYTKKILLFLCVIILFIGSLFIYKVIKADDNSAYFENINISLIETGTENSSFNYDGHDYEDVEINNFISKEIVPGFEGIDSNNENSIVRSFDTIKYHFTYTLNDREGNNYIDSSALTIKYRISFDSNLNNLVSITDEKCQKESDLIYICSFDNKELIDNTSTYEDIINIRVLNTPNNTIIDPKFEIYIEDSTEFSNGFIVLGKNDQLNNEETQEDESHYYAYNNNTYSNNSELKNSLPIIATSKLGNYRYELIETPIKQLGNYDGKTGRFITYILGIRIDSTEGLIGHLYDYSDINFKVGFAQNGLGKAISSNNWIRFYNTETIDEIIPEIISMPYTSQNGSDNTIKNTGSLNVRKTNEVISSCYVDGCIEPTDSYSITLSNFEVASNIPSVAADNTALDVNSPYLATIAITNFSVREETDGNNDIENIITVIADNTYTMSSINTYEDNNISVNRNIYSDYSLNALFYSEDENEILSTKENGYGSISKGSNIKYKTEFTYNNTNSNNGLKEIIKVDTDAYRVIPYSNESNQVDIKIICGENECTNISKDDFEIKYVTGDYINTNYNLITDFTNSRLSNVNKEIANNNCSNIDLSFLNKDQIQNIYGSPCISAINNVEEEFDNLYDNKTDSNIEIPINKVIIQTKNGVSLPDNSKVIITIGLKVRNVSDITQNYQVTSIATTSDYDNELYYYYPNINDSMNYNNYEKTIYGGNNIIYSNQTIHGDDLKIVNFNSKQNITVLNKKNNGSIKTVYDVSDNEIINYMINTKVIDNNIYAGSDDTWFIDNILVYVNIPKELVYLEDKNLISPISVINNPDGSTLLVYKLPYTKPNLDIDNIYFNAYLSPTLNGTNNITVRVSSDIVNINGEIDTTLVSKMGSEFTIEGKGNNNIVNEISTTNSIIEKNGEITYNLKVYNNTDNEVNDYSIVDVLPFNNDNNASSFSGTYSVKINTNNIDISNIKCYKNDVNSMGNNLFDSSINWKSCDNILNDYVDDVTAIKIDNISINSHEYFDDIELIIKTDDNKYGDIYNNSFNGKNGLSIIKSNSANVSIVNRKISGKVFNDMNTNGIQDSNDIYLKNIPITLYLLDNNTLKKVDEKSTDEDGKYEFSKLDSGNYIVRASYDTNKYDLTLRYATENINIDSDAYKIDDNGNVEIRSKEINSNGITLDINNQYATNMDIGLLNKESIGFEIKKYITRVDVNNDGIFNTHIYDNEKTVSLSVLNPRRSNVKVYYGMTVTNNSTEPGYVSLIEENIPKGMIFDSNLQENKDWFIVDDVVQTDSLRDELIKPGETKELQIALIIPSAEQAGTFINNVTIISVRKYNEDVNELSDDVAYINDNLYTIGDSISYAGINFHIVRINGDVLTLLMDENDIVLNHSDSNLYKWSLSNIKTYINNEWLDTNSINPPILVDENICDDASGLVNTNGGMISSINDSCIGKIYISSKIRLLTKEEFDYANNYLDMVNSNDKSWLLGNNDYWLINSSEESDKAYYINHSLGTYDITNVTNNKQVRPVIEISTYNIITK